MHTECFSRDRAGRIPDADSTWAALKALDTLDPPSTPSSPVNGSDALSSLCSHGEILILLDAGLNLGIPDPCGSEDPTRSTSDSLNAANVRAVNDDRVLVTSFSYARVDTPGLRLAPSQDCISEPIGGRRELAMLSASSDSYFSISPYLLPPSVYEDCDPTFYSSLLTTSVTRSSVGTSIGSAAASPVGSPRQISFNVSPSFSTMRRGISPDDVPQSPSLFNKDNLYELPRSHSAIFTGTLGSTYTLSPSPSSTSMLIGRRPPSPNLVQNATQARRLHKSRSCYPLHLPPIALRSPRHVLDVPTPSSEPTTPLTSTFEPRPTLRQRCRTDSNATMGSTRSARSTQSNRISSPLASPAPKRRLAPNLPGVLEWLENIKIEAWIDQDSSHTMRQTLKLVGYNTGPPKDGDTALVNALTYGLADFMPVVRHSFTFDSGKADVPPILRRITIVDDETKDYISQQAILCVSSDGAYNVGGTEFFDLQPHQAPLALRWYFEYFVQVGPHEGGIVLTPLRFSCSPGLLHPSHGRKQTKLLQVFRRSSSAKLLAEKVDVPRLIHLGATFHDRQDALDTSHRENCGLGITPTVDASRDPRPLRRQPSMRLTRPPKLNLDKARPSTPLELLDFNAEVPRTRGANGARSERE